MNLSSTRLNNSGQSDNQTITQTETIQQPIVTLEYLINQNKMKQIALSKATHLIELYKIELQVKQQDYQKELENCKLTQKYNYESIISQLEEKVIKLERQNRHYQQKVQQLQSIDHADQFHQSSSRPPKLARNNSNRQMSQNRKSGTRYSNSKNTTNYQGNQMKRSLSTFMACDASKQQQLYRIEKTFLIKFLLKSQEKDQKMISLFQNQILEQAQDINEKISNAKASDKFIQYFIKQCRQPFGEMETKYKQCKQIIKIQQLIIEQLNRQVSEFRDIISVMNLSLQEIFSKKLDQNQYEYQKFHETASFNQQVNMQKIFQQYTDIIDMTQQGVITKIKHHKSFIKQKVLNMESENKELKRILDEMIKLIKNNKKLQITNQISSFGSIRNSRASQQQESNKEKSRGNFFYSKN